MLIFLVILDVFYINIEWEGKVYQKQFSHDSSTPYYHLFMGHGRRYCFIRTEDGEWKEIYNTNGIDPAYQKAMTDAIEKFLEEYEILPVNFQNGPQHRLYKRQKKNHAHTLKIVRPDENINS